MSTPVASTALSLLTSRASRVARALAKRTALDSRSRRGRNVAILKATASNHVGKIVGEFLVSASNQETERCWVFGQRPCHLPGLLLTHGALGFGVQPATYMRRLPTRWRSVCFGAD